MTASRKSISEEQIFKQAAALSEAARAPYSGSRKIYIDGQLPGVRVGMREIILSDTQSDKGVERNAPIRVYDTSGPYTDPDVSIDINQGLAALRESWIKAREDSEQLA